MALNPDRFRLTETEHQRIFDARIKPQLFSRIVPATAPVAIIFGGQSGSGKSPALALAAQELEGRGGAAQIIGDDLRIYHPLYARLTKEDDKTAAAYTDRDSGLWVEKSIAYARDQKFNIIIEGTMRDGAKVAATMASLRAVGYLIDARALAVNFRLSEQGILQRYEEQKADRGAGRMTTPEAHRAGYDGMLVTLENIEREKLADRITIYRRGAVVLYTNELQDGAWARDPQARLIVEAERNRPMNEIELRDYIAGFDRLLTLMTRPGRNATDQEIRHVEALRRVALTISADLAATEYWERVAEQGRQAGGSLMQGQGRDAGRKPGGRTRT